MAKVACMHGPLPDDVGPRTRYSGRQQFVVCGVPYAINVQVYLPMLCNQMFHCSISVGSEDEGVVHPAVFTTQLGGVFGYVMPVITGGHVVVVWRSGREFCALRALVSMHSEFPPLMGQHLFTMYVGDVAMNVVCVTYNDMLLLLPPHLTVEMPTPTIVYDHVYSVDLPQSGLPDITVHCRVLSDGDMVIHGVTFALTSQKGLDVVGIIEDRGVVNFRTWQYTPRGVQIIGVISPPSHIMWGVDMVPVSNCR